MNYYETAAAATHEEPASQGYGSVASLVLAIPFLAGAENIIGLIIIGIGLYEAWKFNRKPQISITGPHAIAAVQAV